jgi:hypothetical protein
MNEIDYGSVFGIEASTGGNESAAAEQTTAGAETTTYTEDAQGEKESAPAEQTAVKEEQSSEENAKYAAARRKAEQERDAGIAQAQAAAQRQLDEAIAAMGQTDPYTGQPIRTKAEWDAWKTREAQEKKKEVADASGMNEAEFDAFVQNLPSVRDYRRAAEEARQQKQKMILDEQITAIGKLDPSVKTVEDLVKRPEYKQVYDYVKKGISIVDAFKLANYDTLTQSAAAASRQAAINAANSKEHMAPTQTRGSGAVTVPADVKEQYKLFNPTATDAEIQAHYARFHKN